MRPQTLFLTGLVLGAVTALAFLLAGTLTMVPGLVVWTWLVARRPRFVGASGGLIGLGGAWLLLLGQASWRCTNDASCSQPDVTPWLAFGALMVAIGVFVGLGTWRQRAQPFDTGRRA